MTKMSWRRDLITMNVTTIDETNRFVSKVSFSEGKKMREQKIVGNKYYKA